MAFGGTFTTEAIIDSKSGANVAVGVTEAMKTAWSIEAENYINGITQYDFTANYGTISANTAQLLSDAVSSYAAMHAVLYDTSNYTNISEAQTKIAVLKKLYNEAINALLDTKVTGYMS